MDGGRNDNIPENSARQRVCNCKPGWNKGAVEPITCDLCPLIGLAVSITSFDFINEKSYVKSDWN